MLKINSLQFSRFCFFLILRQSHVSLVGPDLDVDVKKTLNCWSSCLLLTARIVDRPWCAWFMQ